MKTIVISQVHPVERAQPETAQELAKALAAGGIDLDELQDDMAAEDITNAAMEIIMIMRCSTPSLSIMTRTLSTIGSGK